MYTPKKNSLRDRVCLKIIQHGPMLMDEIYAHFPAERSNTVKDAVHQLKFYKALTEFAHVYDLSAELRAHYDGVELPEVKQDIAVPTWKPLSIKNIPSLHPLIADRLTGRSFITCSSSLPFQGEW